MKKHIKKIVGVMLIAALIACTMSSAVFAGDDIAPEFVIEEEPEASEDVIEEEIIDDVEDDEDEDAAEPDLQAGSDITGEIIEDTAPDDEAGDDMEAAKKAAINAALKSTKYNVTTVEGTGAKRTLTLSKTETPLTGVRVAVWSKTEWQDDLKWYKMKKQSDGSWSVNISAAFLKHSGKVYADIYAGDTFIKTCTFKFTKAEYKSTINTIQIYGSGDYRTIRLRHPKKAIKKLRVAVWTEENGQDDLKWYTMKKISDGTWLKKISMTGFLHSGKAYAHIYANKSAFIGEKTFTVPDMGFPICQTEEEYIERIAPAVQEACRKHGYLPSVLIAQSCLENGFGIPSYWDNPQISALMRYNNMVGMKSSLLNSSWYDKTVWPGKSVVKKTPEEYDGKRVIITDSFRIYDSIEQSFEDFLLFLKYASNYGYGGKPKYGPKVLAIKSPRKLITTVAKRGYATDSNYPNSVMKIIKKHDLTKYDKI